MAQIVTAPIINIYIHVYTIIGTVEMHVNVSVGYMLSPSYSAQPLHGQKEPCVPSRTYFVQFCRMQPFK